MNNTLVIIGVVLMVAGALFTFFTLGFGIICTWPLILVGIILLIVGAVTPEGNITTSKQEPPQQKVTREDRYCPDCGRAIPFDARICPYCKKDFEEKK